MTTISNNVIKATSLVAERRNLEQKMNSLSDNKFVELNNKIHRDCQEIQNKYTELSKVASPVVENKYLWGLIKSTDVNKSLEGLLSMIQGLAKCTLGAFEANGENLGNVLELIKISASIENDLYKQLEYCDCSKENIANLLHDFCVQYNIDSNVIEGLFEQSFNRTITLRTRIKDLREEILERISKSEERFEHFVETIRQKEEELTSNFDAKAAEYKKQLQEEFLGRISKSEERFEHFVEIMRQREKEFTSNFETKAEEYRKQMDTRINEYLNAVNNYRDELNIVRSSYKQEIESEKNSLMDSIKQYNIELSKFCEAKFEQYERKNEDLKTDINKLSSCVSKLRKYLICSFVISAIIILTIIVNIIV